MVNCSALIKCQDLNQMFLKLICISGNTAKLLMVKITAELALNAVEW